MDTSTADEVDIAKHPAKFSDPIIDEIARYLDSIGFGGMILDPFAGVGRVHTLMESVHPRLTFGVELEPEWAGQHPRTVIGDSRDLAALGFRAGEFQAIVTSPTYGNRMADSHTPSPADTSKRNTYTHTLGRKLSAGNTGAMQWGDEYRAVHEDVWGQCVDVLEDGGLFVLNLSNHIRKGVEVDVTGWHRECLGWLGIEWVEWLKIPTRRNRQGQNGEVRVEFESVLIGVKGDG